MSEIQNQSSSYNSEQLAKLAQQIKIDSNIKLSTDADCGNSFNAKQNINDVADGKLPAICSYKCGDGCISGGTEGDIAIKSTILEGLLSLSQWMQSEGISGGFTITSLTTGSHSAKSLHYQGRAVDITPNSSDPAVWRRIRNYLKGFFGGNPFCERPDGGNDSSCGNADHIHWGV